MLWTLTAYDANLTHSNRSLLGSINPVIFLFLTGSNRSLLDNLFNRLWALDLTSTLLESIHLQFQNSRMTVRIGQTTSLKCRMPLVRRDLSSMSTVLCLHPSLMHLTQMALQ